MIALEKTKPEITIEEQIKLIKGEINRRIEAYPCVVRAGEKHVRLTIAGDDVMSEKAERELETLEAVYITLRIAELHGLTGCRPASWNHHWGK